MKTLLTLSTFCLLLLTMVQGQAPPEAFNYSGAARDAQGNPISEKTIGVELSILKGSPTGGVQYRERHFVNTDKFGVFNCTVGQGSVQQGTFSAITWSNDSYYLRVGLDAGGGTNFVVLGTTQLLSVPYSLYAKNAGSVISGAVNNNNFNVKFNMIPISDSAINHVCTSFTIYDATFLTPKNYIYYLYRGLNISNDISVDYFVTDSLLSNPIYLQADEDNIPGVIYYLKSDRIDGWYYIPFNATKLSLSLKYVWLGNSYDPVNGSNEYYQAIPNNPSITGFNLQLPINVTIER